MSLDCWFKTIGPGRSCDLRPKFWLIVPSRAPLCANIAHPDITGTRRPPIANSIIFCRFWITKPSAKTTPARLAATNKCLARTNKSRTRADATKSGDGSAAQFLSHRPSWRAPLRGQHCRSFTALWRRELRAEAEHELAPSRAVFFPRLLAGYAALLAITYEGIQKFLRNRFRPRFTPGGVQRLEQRSNTRL